MEKCTPEEWNQVIRGQRCLRCGTEHIEIYPSSGKAMCLVSGCDWKISRHGFIPFPVKPEEGLSVDRALNFGVGVEGNEKSHADHCSVILAKEVIRLRDRLVLHLDDCRYWQGISECQCASPIPTGGCLKCDMDKAVELLSGIVERNY